MDLLLDLVLPSTDAAAVTQAVVVGIVLATAFWFVRKNPEPRIFVIGATILSFSLMALRAVH